MQIFFFKLFYLLKGLPPLCEQTHLSRELQPMCSLCGSDFVFLNSSKKNFENDFKKNFETAFETDFIEFDREFEEENNSSKFHNLNPDYEKCDKNYFFFDKALTLFPLLAFFTRINLVIRFNNEI
jgi:hypothetical protein